MTIVQLLLLLLLPQILEMKQMDVGNDSNDVTDGEFNDTVGGDGGGGGSGRDNGGGGCDSNCGCDGDDDSNIYVLQQV